jgi:DNA-directed RNA polymerase specialized sigma24 family protein
MDPAPPAFSAFYDIEQPRVHRAVTLILGDPERAARITHESFVRTHAMWPRAGADALLATLRCAFRLAWRARPDAPAAGGALTIDLRDTPVDRDVDLELALASLPRAQRSAVVLSYYLGLELRDIAEVMSISPTEAATHLDRARTQLVALLGEEHHRVS